MNPHEPSVELNIEVRPYTLTGGRTSTDAELALETQIRSIDRAEDEGLSLSPEERRIIRLCRQPQSVAEVSAHLGLPLQVTKVLIGDLLMVGHLAAHDRPDSRPNSRPDIELLERVLEGLQSL